MLYRKAASLAVLMAGVVLNGMPAAQANTGQPAFFDQILSDTSIVQVDALHSVAANSAGGAQTKDMVRIAGKKAGKRFKRSLHRGPTQAAGGFKSDNGNGATADEDPHATCNQSSGDDDDCYNGSIAGQETACRLTQGGMSSEPGGGTTCSIAPLN